MRGGQRKGAGRKPKGLTNTITIRIDDEAKDYLRKITENKSQSEAINELLKTARTK